MITVFRQLKNIRSIRFISNAYTQLTEGNGISQKIFLIHNNKKVSPWHDIFPFTERPDEILMVNEIPR